jgi:hypothetical protein
MISWQLWYALRHPPYRHILFQRMIAPRLADAYWAHAPHSHPTWFLMLIGVTFACILGMTPLGRELISGVFLALLCILPLVAGLLIFNGFVYGLRFAGRISVAVATNAGRGRYELIALAPPGAMGMAWMIAVASIYREKRPVGLNYDHTWYLRVFLLLLFGVLLYTALDSPWNEQERIVIVAAYVFTQALAFHIDDVQSVTTGVVLGLAAAAWQPRPLAARTTALLAYLAVHLVVYSLTVIVALLLLPALWPSHFSWLAAALLPGLRLALFYGLREGVITVIWYQLARRLNGGEADVRLVTQWT